jgi:hypothetical protein
MVVLLEDDELELVEEEGDNGLTIDDILVETGAIGSTGSSFFCQNFGLSDSKNSLRVDFWLSGRSL